MDDRTRAYVKGRFGDYYRGSVSPPDFGDEGGVVEPRASGDREWAFDAADLVKGAPTVAADPESGHSVGSRVWLGTLGHHGEWRHAGQKIRRDETATTTAGGTTTGGPGGETATPGTASDYGTTRGPAGTSTPEDSGATTGRTAGSGDEDDETTAGSDSVPGFVVGTALAGLAGAGALARRRPGDDAE